MKYYLYHADGSYAGSCESRRMPHNSASEAPPELPWDHLWPRYSQDNGWLLIDDHRARSAQEYGPELAQDATAYWLPDDDWQAQPRQMTRIGPLPEGALLERPEKPRPTREELFAGLRAARAARLAATDYLLMPDYPLDQDKKAGLLAYRQALRDLPGQPGAPWDGGEDGTPWPAPCENK